MTENEQLEKQGADAREAVVTRARDGSTEAELLADLQRLGIGPALTNTAIIDFHKLKRQ